MKEYISEYGVVSEAEVLTLAEKYYNDKCSVYAVHTDHFYCGSELSIEVGHLIELRIFTSDMELKISRLNIGEDFRWRYIDDPAFEQTLHAETDEFLSQFKNRTYDEEQYLDIDSNKSKGLCYVTTGGGSYTLPIENAEKIKIRNYLEYDENGIVLIPDFRIVEFIQKGSGENA